MTRTLTRVLLALLLVALAGIGLLYRDQLRTEDLQAWIESAGGMAPALFVCVYALATLAFLPGAIVTLVGGALFGPLWGTLWNLTGATTGAALAFLAARHLGADWVERRAGPRLRQLTDGVAAEGWRFVAFVRLVPLFPFNLLNFALGLTRISFAQYLLASWLFMIPGTLAYTYLGYAGREAAGGGEGLIEKALVALALLAAASFLPRLIARLRRGPMLTVHDLKQRLDRGDDLLVLDVRTAADFTGDQGHLAVARHLPLEDLPYRLEELEPWLERPVAIICRTDRRSAKAAALLTRAGFADVHVVRGGMTAWREQGSPAAAEAPKAER